jgi:hypothetical protein
VLNADDKGLVFLLNERARTCPDVLQQKLLKDMALEVRQALDALHKAPTVTAMQDLNGLWVRAVNMLHRTEPNTQPPRGGAFREGARLAA